jgi:hypothetical protein
MRDGRVHECGGGDYRQAGQISGRQKVSVHVRAGILGVSGRQGRGWRNPGEALVRELEEELSIAIDAFSLWKVKEKKVKGTCNSALLSSCD